MLERISLTVFRNSLELGTYVFLNLNYIILNCYIYSRCGYATIHNVLDKSIEDRMESFFLSETTKYLYLVCYLLQSLELLIYTNHFL